MKWGSKMLDILTFNLNELNVITIMVRVLLAIFIGGLIGTERDMRQRSAGIRTHMLVCLGAAIVMMTNEYIYLEMGDGNIDITRMGAQVVSGIGFIGAGTILVTRDNRIKGLTTAAGLWAAAALGLGIGIGFYEMAVIGAIAIVGIMIVMKPYRDFIQDRASQSDLTLMIHSNDGFSSFLDFLSHHTIQITDLRVENEVFQNESEHQIIFLVSLELGEKIHKDEIIDKLNQYDEVLHVFEILDAL